MKKFGAVQDGSQLNSPARLANSPFICNYKMLRRTLVNKL